MKYISLFIFLFFASFASLSQSTDSTNVDKLELIKSSFDKFMQENPPQKGKKKNSNKGKPEEEEITEVPSIGTMSVEPTWDEPEIVEPGFVNEPISAINACSGENISLNPGILDFTNLNNFIIIPYQGNIMPDVQYENPDMGWRFTGHTQFYLDLDKSIPIDPNGYYRIEVEVFNDGTHECYIGGFELASNRYSVTDDFNYFLPENPLTNTGEFLTFSQEKSGTDSNPYNPNTWYPGTEYFVFAAYLNYGDFYHESTTFIREIRIYGNDKYTGEYVNYVLNGAEIHWNGNGAPNQSETYDINNISSSHSGIYQCDIIDIKTGMQNRKVSNVSVGQNTIATSDKTICSGSSVTLSASGGTTYSWSPTTGLNNPNIANPIASPTATTTYTVTTNSTCVKTDQLTVNVNARPAQPTITTSGSTSICAGDNVTLTSSTGTSYLWSNGATTRSITVNTSGTYNVKVKNAAGCESISSTNTNVAVRALPSRPTITASGPTTFCAGGSVTLTSSSESNYSWSNGATTKSIAVSSSGTYNVKVKNVYGCESVTSTNKTVTVNALPNADAGEDITIFEDSNVPLEASGGSSYDWTPKTGLDEYNSPHPLTTGISTNTTYVVNVTNSAGCSATDQVNVTVVPLPILPPVVATMPPVEECKGQNRSLVATMPIIEIDCNPEDYFDIIGDFYYLGPDEGWEANGECTITLKEEWAIPIDKTKIYQVQIDLFSPEWSATTVGGYALDNSMNPVTGQLKEFLFYNPYYNSPSFYLYDPMYGDGVNLKSPLGFITFEKILNEWGNDFQNWESGTEYYQFSATFNIGEPGATTFIRDIRIIDYNSQNDYIQNYIEYQWKKDGVDIPGKTYDYLSLNNLDEADEGTYSCIVRDGYTLKSNSTSANVTVNPSPNITLSSDSDICSGESKQLIASGGTSYSWSPSTGLSNTTGSTTTATPSSSQIYTVLVTDTKGCAASEQVNVNLKPQPAVAINTPKSFACNAEAMSFTSSISPGYSSINWYLNNSYNMTTEHVNYVMPNVGNNTVKLAVELNGCTSEVTQIIDRRTLPIAPNMNDVNKEYPAQVTLNANTTDDVKWYSEGATTPIALGNTFTSDIHDDKVYEMTVHDGYCESDKETIRIEIVNPTPSTLYSIGSGMWNTFGTWAASEGGEPTVVFPNENTTVIIKGDVVEINENNQSSNIFILDGGANSSKLKITNGTLTVNGQVVLTRDVEKGQIDLDISPAGKLICVDPNN